MSKSTQSDQAYRAWLLAIAILFVFFAFFVANQAAADDAPIQQLRAQAYQAAVAKVAPSVLRIETFGGLEKVDKVLVGRGPTTGVAVSKDGYVLSSAFNFVQKPNSILVSMPSGRRAAANIVARDTSRMLVLLKVNSDEELTVPEIAGRNAMTVGQTTIAVGRTFDATEPNLSVGILSAKHRIWGKAIQTDSKISPANYGGPLIDLRGRVLGILSPMSPQGSGAVAGAEWYDSGIGFAVPLEDILPRLDKLKQGHDLKPGLLGVSLKGEMYKAPIEIAARPPNSPAAAAGLQKGDHIVQVAGKPVRWQAEMRHVLGPLYAGDTVEVVVKRGDERITAKVELAAEIEPFDISFLGILPSRSAGDEPGVGVRYIYPSSPADEGGLKVGDRITQAGETKIESTEQLRDIVGTHDRASDGELILKVQRGGKSLDLAALLTSLPTEIPADLPPLKPAGEPRADGPATGVVPIKLLEERNEAVAIVPANYRADLPHSLVVTLHAPGKFDEAALKKRWQELAEQHHLIVLAPKAAKRGEWEPTEVEFITKTIEEVRDRYSIDPLRIVVHGYQAGGSMAYLTVFGNPELIRGVAAVDAAPPGRAAPPDADPVHRMAYYIATAKESPATERSAALTTRLKRMLLPVTARELGDKPRQLSAKELAELARWVDSLDRI